MGASCREVWATGLKRLVYRQWVSNPIKMSSDLISQMAHSRKLIQTRNLHLYYFLIVAKSWLWTKMGSDPIWWVASALHYDNEYPIPLKQREFIEISFNWRFLIQLTFIDSVSFVLISSDLQAASKISFDPHHWFRFNCADFNWSANKLTCVGSGSTPLCP